MERTEAYQFTVTSKDDPQVIALKKQVAFANKLSREATRGYNYSNTVHALWRVRLMPRGSRVESAWDDYKSRRAYDSYLPQRHADRFDVYIHRDTTAERMMQRELDTGLTSGQLRKIDAAENAVRLAEFEQMKALREQGIYTVHTRFGIEYQSREQRIEELRARGISESTIERLI